MLTIDGSEGGGQLLRSTLALAALTGEPVRVDDIRGNRPEPGLKPQHLAAVETVSRLANATVEGASQGSESVIFAPGALEAHDLTVEIPTAGSLTLLFDAVLPLAAALDEPVTLTATGGTEVAWSPPLTAHQQVKLPLCRGFGLAAAIERHRTGFYPAGGGRARLSIGPSQLAPVALTDRGELESATVHSRASRDLADADVATRQASEARDLLAEHDIPVQEESVAIAETASTGSSVVIVFRYERTRAGFDALGETGTPAEDVAATATEAALEFHRGSAAVDRHIGDQLLILLALAGGELRVPELTDHVEASISLLERFGLPVRVDGSDETPVVLVDT
ncbi:MAG: RNA 3'-terminal phosphate cyclase [Halovenus sp.]